MNTRCKFHCSEVTKRIDCSYDSLTKQTNHRFVYDAKFYAVNSGEENKKFFASTPGGSLTVTTLRDDQFEPGQDYYLDISLVKVAEPQGA